jgi:hypothetical protein
MQGYGVTAEGVVKHPTRSFKTNSELDRLWRKSVMTYDFFVYCNIQTGSGSHQDSFTPRIEDEMAGA